MPAETTNAPKLVPIEKRREHSAQRDRFMLRLAQLQAQGWFGTLTLKVEGGELVMLTASQTFVDL